MVRAQGGICPLCALPLAVTESWTIDHIRPRSQGGSNDPRNLQIVHHACNGAKGDAWDGTSGHPPGSGIPFQRERT